MIRPDLFNPAAAQRYADWLTSVDADAKTVRVEVASWFADVFGWPLTGREVDDYRAFLALVTERMEARR